MDGIGGPLDGLAMDAPDLIDQVVERFRRRHEALYTYSAEDQDVVLVNARLTIVRALPVTPVEPRALTAGAAAPAKLRRAYLGAWTAVPVYRWDTLTPKAEIAGPAIFESAPTTVVGRAGDQVRVTPYGWLDIRMS